MPNLQAPAHWSKDFVEHLRTVHFTLIALCVGLIILALFPSKSEIQIAHAQVSEILEVVNTWGNGDFFQIEAHKAVEDAVRTGSQTASAKAAGEPSVAPFDIALRFSDRTYWINPRVIEPGLIIKHDIPSDLLTERSKYNFNSGSQLEVTAPGSIESFRRLWDGSLKTGSVVRSQIPRECFAVVEKLGRSGFESMKCEIHPRDAAHAADRRWMVLVPANEDRVRSLALSDRWRFEFSDTPFTITQAEKRKTSQLRVTVLLPARESREIQFDGQRVLIHRSPSWHNKRKMPFKDAFRELASVSGPFENADIISAEKILDAEAKRTGDAFEAVGLKIPAEVAVRCGVLLVLGVQLYLLIHLREFGNRLDREAGYEVAWIGVYSSKLARVMLLVSLLLLPACTVVLLSFRGLSMTEHKQIAWAALAASNLGTIVLSYLVFHALPKRIDQGSNAPEPPTPPSCPAQSFE